VSLTAWILALAITAIAALLQGTVGVGFGMLSVPLLSLIDPSLAPAPQLLVALPLTITMAWRERKAIDLHGFWWIIGGRIPGAVLGVALLAIASQRMLDVFTALIVLGAVAAIALGVRIRRTPRTKLAAGMTSGTTGVVAAIGGPPVALLYSSDDSDIIRSTLAAVFTIGISTSIIFRYASGNLSASDVRVSAVLLPAVLIGYVVSLAVKDRIPKDRVRSAILVVSGFGACALLVRALVA
jgi:uncharacterized membrane protein YfcA